MKGKGRLLILLAAAVFLLLAPSFAGNYWIRVLTSIFMFAVLAEGTNIISGFCGYPAFGNVVFFGAGAYVTAILMARYNFPFLPAVAIGGVCCAAYAASLGLPILRLRGHYFAIATLGVNEATRQVVDNLYGFTGGASGLTLPIVQGRVVSTYSLFYYAMFFVMAATVLAAWLISRNRFGYGLRAIRNNEEAAATMGVNTTAYKIFAWTISAFFLGLAGGVYAYWNSYIEPRDVFDILIAVKFFIMILLGGAGTVMGPVIGAFLLELISEVLWSRFLTFHTAILGLIIIMVVIFMPRGFMDLIGRRFSISAFLFNIRENRV